MGVGESRVESSVLEEFSVLYSNTTEVAVDGILVLKDGPSMRKAAGG